MSEELKSRIIQENLRIHQVESSYYDMLHTELNNKYITKKINKDIDIILDDFKEDSPYVLDLGAGTGNLSILFLQRGCRVHAVDISPKMLNVCRQKVKRMKVEHQVKFTISESEKFLKELKEEKFSVICISSLLHHIYDYFSFLKLLDRYLISGGILYIVWEPISSNYAYFSFLARVVDFIDNKFFQKYIRKLNVEIKNIDYSFSDYHTHFGNGCDKDSIISYFREKNYSIVESKNFSGIGKRAFTAWLHNTFRLSYSHFRIILKKSTILGIET